jgi:hypothetical protein
VLPGELLRGAAGDTEDIVSARDLYHFWNPVASCKDRIGPLERKYARRSGPSDNLSNFVDTIAQSCDQICRSILNSGKTANQKNRIEDLVQGRGLQRHHLGWRGEGPHDTLDFLWAHRADVAKLLGKNEVGAHVLQ